MVYIGWVKGGGCWLLHQQLMGQHCNHLHRAPLTDEVGAVQPLPPQGRPLWVRLVGAMCQSQPAASEKLQCGTLAHFTDGVPCPCSGTDTDQAALRPSFTMHSSASCAPCACLVCLQGRAVLAVEVWRPSPASSSQDLAKIAKQAVSMGADAIVVRQRLSGASTSCSVSVSASCCRCVFLRCSCSCSCARVKQAQGPGCKGGPEQHAAALPLASPTRCSAAGGTTLPCAASPIPHSPAAGAAAACCCHSQVRTDVEDTPEGLKDLLTVVQAVRVPVLRRDWIIHPLQVVEAKEAGAAGVIGVIGQVGASNGVFLCVHAGVAGMVGFTRQVGERDCVCV